MLSKHTIWHTEKFRDCNLMLRKVNREKVNKYFDFFAPVCYHRIKFLLNL
jgi:hypothetical protein